MDEKTMKCLGRLFVVLVFVVAATCIVMLLEPYLPCTSYKGVLEIILSGVVGALISAVVVLWGLADGNESRKIDNQLKLRELFSEERRWEVFRTIQTGDKSYWYNKTKETDAGESQKDNPTKWEDSEAYKHYFLPALYDYLGLFEVAYMMLRKNQLSKKDFKTSYRYRLEDIAATDYVMSVVYNSKDEKYWKTLKKLMSKFC